MFNLDFTFAGSVLSVEKPWPGNFKTVSSHSVKDWEKDFNQNKGSFAEDLRGHHVKVEWLLADDDLRERFEEYVCEHGTKKGENIIHVLHNIAALSA